MDPLDELQRARIKKILERRFREQFPRVADFGVGDDSEAFLCDMLAVLDQQNIPLRDVEIALGLLLQRLAESFAHEMEVAHDTQLDYNGILERLRAFERTLGQEVTDVLHPEARRGERPDEGTETGGNF
ncbi:MAG TPA: hypothetical protein DCS29_01240 [Candidatus Magasanikbacteria bacterium]|nr:MAG: hypothetical protein A2479_02935 [Candidatus Magasanikbacteria bacterium RIFOXYC2_FULL_39_8]HAT03386.1 hypothetical protein [Candidatus Magasanikbacteria bacterium]